MELITALGTLSEQLSAGKVGKAILGAAAKLKPGDPVVSINPERAMVATKVKQLKKYAGTGRYEFIFTAASVDGEFTTDYLSVEEGTMWRMVDKPHHEPFQPQGVAGGRVVIDKANLNTGSRGSYDPPFLGQTINGKTYAIRGHMVAFVFGGPGGRNNIVALTNDANERMRTGIEVPLSKEIKTRDTVYVYIARPIFIGGTTPQPADSVEVEATRIYPDKQPKKVGFSAIKND